MKRICVFICTLLVLQAISAQNISSILKDAFDKTKSSNSRIAQDGLRIIMQYAERGNGEAQNDAALCYVCGYAVKQDFNKATYWFKQSIENGEKAAMINLAQMYEDKLGHYKNAAYWYDKALNSSENKFQEYLCLSGLADLYSGRRYMRCLDNEQLKEGKIVNKKGYCDEFGDITDDRLLPIDYNKALAYYELLQNKYSDDNQKRIDFCKKQLNTLFEQSNSEESQLYIEAYYKAAGGDTNSFILLKTEADKGDALCQGLLGECYFYGWGTKPNIKEAVRWTKIAADDGKGDMNAINELAYYLSEGIGIEKDTDKAIELRKIVAKGGVHPKNRNHHLEKQALYNLGVEYNDKGDIKTAVDYWMEAAKFKDATACYNIALTFMDTENEELMEAGIQFYQKAIDYAIEDDNREQWEYEDVVASSYYNMGGYFLYIKQDKSKALKYYKAAVQYGHAKAASMVYEIEGR